MRWFRRVTKKDLARVKEIWDGDQKLAAAQQGLPDSIYEDIPVAAAAVDFELGSLEVPTEGKKFVVSIDWEMSDSAIVYRAFQANSL
jgi:hypothetical protein